ncbi:MAG: zeta toxin family protein [Lactobacillales bacterium]|jgi:predicted ABC-type ATPase|nr:zeta toxin family protein [Lactobacillales bacterium]
MLNKPIYVIIAGSNGSGKSTYYRTFKEFSFELRGSIRINPDEILANQGSKWSDEQAQFQSGKTAVRMICDCIKSKVSFNQETTLSGNVTTHIRRIEKAKANGFSVFLIYVGLSSVELAKQRIAERVLKGGHGIPDEVVERRYKQSFSNLKEIIGYCDAVEIVDNNVDYDIVYSRERDKIKLNKLKNYPYLKNWTQ